MLDFAPAPYCAWGCFRIFCWEAVLTCRAAAGRGRRGNAIAKSGVAAHHAARIRRINKQSQAAR
jgi:hypothetical protein